MRATLLLLTIWPLAAHSAPNPAVSGAWVADEAGMLSSAEQSRLRGILQRLHRRTDAQLVILTVPEITGFSPREYAIRRFREWRLGSAAKNDGILLLLARQERAIEIVTGTGLAQSLPAPLLAGIIQSRLVPALRDGQPAEALAGAAKDIAAHLAGFPRAQPASPVLPAAIALLGAALGLAATALLWRFRRRPLPLPATGCEPAAAHYQGESYRFDRFRDDTPEQFYRHQSGRPPGGSESYPAPLLWGAGLGMALAAGALASLAVLAMPPDLEPSFWWLWAALGVLCPLSAIALGPVNTGEWTAVPFLAALVGIPGGFLPAFAATQYLYSDFALAVYVAPGAVFFVNLALACFLIRGFYGWTPERFSCESCGSAIHPLTPEEITAALPAWNSQVPKSSLVRFRGWRCAARCAAPYLAFAPEYKEAMCAGCNAPTRVLSRTASHRIRTCALCGAVDQTLLPKPGDSYSQIPSTGEPAAAASSSSETYPQDQCSYRQDDPPAGGATDGDGAGGNW